MHNWRSILLLFLLLSVAGSAFGQSSTVGKEFWVGFMNNIHDPILELYISTDQQATVQVNSPLTGYSETLVVNPDVTSKLELPGEFKHDFEGVSKYGIHIVSDVNISVYALNKAYQSADATVVLPVQALGKEYIVMSHKEEYSLESEMLVVGTEDGTEIEVILSADTFGGWLAGDSVSLVLNAGEMLQLKSWGDFSGTRVRAKSSADDCKNFAVFGGSMMTFVGECGSNQDHLYEQMFPISTWGREYLYVPYKGRNGDFLKIIALENGTEVQVQGRSTLYMDEGEVVVLKDNLIDAMSISADKPISVAQFARSQDCDGLPGDPFMIMLSPMEQRLEEITFNAFEIYDVNQFYLNLIAYKDSYQQVTLDGINMASEFQENGDYAFARLNISRGNHHLVAPEGVIAYVYGFGNIESFGYSAGAALENFELGIEVQTNGQTISNGLACYNQELELSAILGEDTMFTHFEWDFGDGNYAEGKDAKHVYRERGEYTIALTASDGSGHCGMSEEVYFNIQILEPEILNIKGAKSVCPNVEEIEYVAEFQEASCIKWTVIGGTIADESFDGSLIKVNWGDGQVEGLVIATPFNDLGCSGEVYEQRVMIDNRLQPETPLGDTFLCFADRHNVKYSVSRINGSEHEWYVEGGQILGSNSENEIIVNWESGKGTVWYREYNPAISDCFGFSEKLSVEIMEDILAVEEIVHVACNGENTGAITLAVQGGVAPYHFSWSNGISGLNQNIIEDLPIGTYDVVIVDAAGCTNEYSYTVEEPEVLSAVVEVEPVLCNGESNGESTVLVSGGVSPFSFVWSHDPNALGSKAIGLKAGSYWVKVIDSNDCEFQVSYSVTEPEVLTASSVNSPTCPGEQTGSIFVTAKGGTPPYTYRWNTSPPQDGQLIKGLPAGIYSVTVTDANGCIFTFNNQEIEEKYPKLFLPNVFSPNGDQINDTFFAVHECSIEYFEMKIYNSWGQLIFHTNSISEEWDGSFNGNDAPIGKYTYSMVYRTAFNGEPIMETKKGQFTLVR